MVGIGVLRAWGVLLLLLLLCPMLVGLVGAGGMVKVTVVNGTKGGHCSDILDVCV
jgi:hypothetical protein